MTCDIIVVDGFYRSPDAVRVFALDQDYTDYNGEKAFLGRESRYPYFDAKTVERFEELVNTSIEFTDRHIFGKFRIASADEERRNKVHFDRCAWAANIYLTPGLPAESGLGIYRHKDLQLDRVPTPSELAALGYSSIDDFDANLVLRDSLDPSKWELIELIEPRYNRLVILPGGKYFHAAESGAGRTSHEGRLSQHFFFERSSG